MEMILGITILAISAVGMIGYIKLAQYRHPKAALWYFVGAYCIANGDAEMRRIRQRQEHYRDMEAMCGGKVERRLAREQEERQ